MTSNQSPLFFVDLDDSLFNSARKTQGDDLAVVATKVCGSPASYMNGVQQQFSEWLLNSAVVIPVTGRCRSALSRVNLPFRHGAICGFGMDILDAQGRPDQQWSETIRADLEEYQFPLEAGYVFVNDHAISLDIPATVRLKAYEDGHAAYIQIKVRSGDPQKDKRYTEVLLGYVHREFSASRFNIHSAPGHIDIIPTVVSKQRAVTEWMRRDGLDPESPSRPIIGLGDSGPDTEFLKLCHWFATPANSVIANTLFWTNQA